MCRRPETEISYRIHCGTDMVSPDAVQNRLYLEFRGGALKTSRPHPRRRNHEAIWLAILVFDRTVAVVSRYLESATLLAVCSASVNPQIVPVRPLYFAVQPRKRRSRGFVS